MTAVTDSPVFSTLSKQHNNYFLLLLSIAIKKKRNIFLDFYKQRSVIAKYLFIINNKEIDRKSGQSAMNTLYYFVEIKLLFW